jgi:hypothetical protein
MSAKIQYDLFKDTSDIDVVKAELAALKESHDKVRKGLFKRHNELAKMYMQQQEELDYLKCKVGLACQVK